MTCKPGNLKQVLLTVSFYERRQWHLSKDTQACNADGRLTTSGKEKGVGPLTSSTPRGRAGFRDAGKLRASTGGALRRPEGQRESPLGPAHTLLRFPIRRRQTHGGDATAHAVRKCVSCDDDEGCGGAGKWARGGRAAGVGTRAPGRAAGRLRGRLFPTQGHLGRPWGGERAPLHRGTEPNVEVVRPCPCHVPVTAGWFTGLPRELSLPRGRAPEGLTKLFRSGTWCGTRHIPLQGQGP